MSRTRFGLAVLGSIVTFALCLLIASRPLAAQGRPSHARAGSNGARTRTSWISQG